MRKILILLGVVLAAGCAHNTRDVVRPVLPTRLDVGHGVSFDPPDGWWIVRLYADPTPKLTPDGIDVDALEFRTDLAPGSSVFAPFVSEPQESVADPRRGPKPTVVPPKTGLFRADMSEAEVLEAFVVGLAARGGRRIETDDLRPAPFGLARGFRFSFRYVDERGLEMSGTAAAAIRDGRLDLIAFYAPSEYLFARHKAAVDAVFASIKTE